ncbi:ABC transporter permease [Streptomyces sp. TG1A-60]|uniref:ABC transporter permease n=1 Tax=Streptomyces sp. TG1A-60 TaxID=3129111 RepID=UPI0030CAAB0E
MNTTTAGPSETSETPASRSGAGKPAPTRGLVRAVLRLHQSALWFWGLLVLPAVGGLLWAAGPGADAAWAEYRAGDCAEGEYCASYLFDSAVTVGTVVLTIAPVLIGAWAGGALIARELENGTARLAWTQSVTPARWLAAKLAVPAVLIASGTVLLTLLHRLLWWSDEELLRALGKESFTWETFAAGGPVATAWALLALAVGALAGLLIRRSLPALAVGFLGTAVIEGTLRVNRHLLWPAETLVSKSTNTEWTDPEWTAPLVDQGAVTASGEHVSYVGCEGPACDGTDVVGYYAVYHPSSHFWPLQLVETGITLALTALLVLAAFRLLRRRTGGAV